MSERAAHGARRGTPTAPLPSRFYARDTELVARDLLGAVVECHTDTGVVSGRIVETEAYLGEHDPACHAAAGETDRTRWLYGPPGTAYVYFIYGTSWCFNAVTRPVRQPSAVLIRALEPLTGLELMWGRRPRAQRDRDLTNGPGKLCSAFAIDGRFNGARLWDGPVRILHGGAVDDADVVVTARIGITKAASWPLRWYDRTSPFVSVGAARADGGSRQAIPRTPSRPHVGAGRK